MIELVKWDSEHFNLRIGKIFICSEDEFYEELLLEKAKEANYELLYIYSNKALPVRGFCDERVVFSKERKLGLENKPSNNTYIIKSHKNGSLSNDILELAYCSGEFSRYKLDTKFPRQVFYDLYYNWIYNSISTNFAHDVLICWDNDKPVGLLTYDICGEESSIGIIAVDKSYRGVSIGSYLHKFYESILPDSVKKLNVVTQGVNNVAKKFYEKNGYSVENISYTHHLWLNNNL